MDRAAVDQVADERDGQAVGAALEVHDREEVEQGLRGVLADAVAAADDDGVRAEARGQLVEGLGGLVGGAHLRVAQHDDVRVAAHGAHGVGQVLALVDRREVHAAAGGDDLAAQALHGRLEGHVRAGAGLVEERGHDLALAERQDRLVALAHLRPKVCCQGEEAVEVGPRELLHRDDVAAAEVAADGSRHVVLLCGGHADIRAAGHDTSSRGHRRGYVVDGRRRVYRAWCLRAPRQGEAGASRRLCWLTGHAAPFHALILRPGPNSAAPRAAGCRAVRNRGRPAR